MTNRANETVTRGAAAALLAAAGETGQVTCPRAFQIARRLGVPPAAVGAVADDVGVRVTHCQLGLFGYGSKAEGKSKIVQPVHPAPDAIARRLGEAAGAGASVTCAQVWEAARQARVSRLQAAGAAQGLGIRVSECQLGCFKPRPATRR